MAALTKYVSDFEIQLAPMNTIGALVGIKRTGVSKESTLTTICPTCDDVTKVNQVYTCPNGHGPFKVGECGKAKEVTKGTFVKVSAEEAKEAGKSDLPLNSLELTIHQAAEVEAQTFPAEHAYVFYPKTANRQYAILAELVADPDLAYVGMCNIRNSEKLLRVRLWGDNLVVHALQFPEELNPREVVSAEADEKFRSLMAQFIEGQVAEFEPNAYRNRKRERIAQLTESGEAFTVATKLPDSDDAAMERLMEMLQANQK